MRDDSSIVDEMENESGTGEVATPSCRYLKQFDVSVREFNDHQRMGGERGFVKQLLVLGGIKQLYWLALGDGAGQSAKTIAEWWEAAAPVHLHL